MNEKDFNSIIHSSKLISSPHGFSTRNGGVSFGIFESLNLGWKRGDEVLNVCENWKIFLKACGMEGKDCVFGNQVHGTNVHVATKADALPILGQPRFIEADGYVTKEPGVPIAISVADCVPVLLEDPENRVAGAVHSGWRSTVADIEGVAIGKMISLGADVSKIRAAIGPAIDKCCFEVGKEVVTAVDELLGGMGGKFASKRAGAEKYMLDLRGVVRERLIQLGIKEENIELVGGCTMCHPQLYFSHRYSKGQRGAMYAIIMLPPL